MHLLDVLEMTISKHMCSEFEWCAYSKVTFLYFSELCWLVEAFPHGLTGKAMMSVFLFTARCRGKWICQKEDQGKAIPVNWTKYIQYRV